MSKPGFLTTSKVMELTLMSRANIVRKVKVGEFPAPAMRGKQGSHLFAEDEVRQWMDANLNFLRSCRARNLSTLEMHFDKADMREIKHAAKLLHCESLEAFVMDAAIWKARKITELAGEA